jgi:hypothetical protein
MEFHLERVFLAVVDQRDRQAGLLDAIHGDPWPIPVRLEHRRSGASVGRGADHAADGLATH